MKIGITADCSSGLEYAPFEHKVKITRTTIHFDKEELVDGIDITADEFYEKLKHTDIVPSTSAPTIGEITSRVEEWKNEGCTDVIHFAISYGLSTYGENLEVTGDELVEGVKLHVFNSNTACLMEGYNAYYAQKLAEKGYTVEQIFAECDKVRKGTTAFFVVDDLKYLVKNGRLSKASGLIGRAANIKPILNLNDEGKIVPYKKVRAHAKAVDKCLELIKETSINAKKVLYIVLHTGRLDDAKELAKKLEASVTNAKHIDVVTVTPTVGAHIGCGIIGIGRIILDDLKEELV